MNSTDNCRTGQGVQTKALTGLGGRTQSKLGVGAIFAATCALLAVVLMIGAATSHASNKTAIVNLNQPQASLGGGQYLFNHPGAYYMGHLWVGDQFKANTFSNHLGQSGWTYTGENGSTYLFGKMPRAGSLCFWAGPSQSQDAQTNWFSYSGSTSVNNVCDGATTQFLRTESNFGSTFNCQPGSGGNGPARTIVVAAGTRTVYGNLAWTRDSSQRYVANASSGRDPVGTVSQGQRIDYRYTTLDGNWQVVYVPGGIGWGFVQAGTVNRYGTAHPATYDFAHPNPSDPPAVSGWTNNAGSNTSNSCTKNYASTTAPPVPPPTASITSPAPGQMMTSSSVTVTFSVSGPATWITCQLDGGAANPCASSTTMTGLTGGTHTVTVTASNGAGSGSSAVTFNVPGPPGATIATPPNGAVYQIGQSVNASYSCSPGVFATIASCTGTVANGSSVNTATPGTKTFTVTATDNFGQTSSTATNYSVAGAPTVSIVTPASGANYQFESSVQASYLCSPGTGATIISCSGNVPNGSSVDMTTGGSNTFTVTATDNLGQTTTVVNTYNVIVDSATQIAGGTSHTCDRLTTGGVKCWGENFLGQLGDGTRTYRNSPVAVVGLSSGVNSVAAGRSHSCAVLASGTVKCWGANNSGELGNGTNTDSNTPMSVVGLSSGATAVAAGLDFSCALLNSGSVNCWGYNSWGKLGNGTNVASNVPVQVAGLSTGVTAISVGDDHGCALLSTGGVKCWGANNYGQSGNGTTTFSYAPVDVSGLSTATAITAGKRHNCALLTSGGIKCWGSSEVGQVGNGSTYMSKTPADVYGLTSGVSAVAAGGQHTCAVLTSGAAQCWGGIYQGGIGDGTNSVSYTPVAVSGLTSGISAITAGHDHSCALFVTGAAKCWGNNVQGQLGDGTNVNAYAPVNVRGMVQAPPTVTITSPTAGQFVNSATASFAFATTNAPTGTTCAIDGGVAGPCTSPTAFSGLAQGNHTATVSVTNAVGSATASVAFVVDAIAPTVAITAPGSGATVTSPTSVSFAATDATTLITKRTCKIDAGTAVNCVSPYLTPTLADGSHSITVAATDQAGNVGTAVLNFQVLSAFTLIPSTTASAAHPDVTAQFTLPASPDVKSLAITLPQGLHITPAAIASPCSLADASAGSCAGTTEIGSVSALAQGGLTASGSLYLTIPPTSADAAGIALKLTVSGGLGIVVSVGSLSLNNIGVNQPNQKVVFSDIPNTTESSNAVHFSQMSFAFAGATGAPTHPLITNPSTCPVTPLSASGTATATDASTATSNTQYPVTGCASVPFTPGFSESYTDLTAGQNTNASFTFTVPGENSSISRMTLKLPAFLDLDYGFLGQNADKCPGSSKTGTASAPIFNPASCPDAAKIGTASVMTPMSAVPLTGTIYSINSGFPVALGFSVEQNGITIRFVATWSWAYLGKTCSSISVGNCADPLPSDTCDIDLQYCPAGWSISMIGMPEMPVSAIQLSFGAAPRTSSNGSQLGTEMFQSVSAGDERCASSSTTAVLIPYTASPASGVTTTHSTSIAGC